MKPALKVATYNVNGVNGRLPRLLEWLRETNPDVVCLQEIRTDDTKFPSRAIEEAGYGAIWHGQRSHHGTAILAKGEKPEEIRRGSPGDAEDRQARYLEAKVKGLIVASVYLPNGNPVPSPNFDYKLRWFERFIRHAGELHGSGAPTVPAGDLNVVPTDFDIYNPGWWRFDAVMQPEARDAYKRLLSQDSEYRGREKPSDHAPFWVSLEPGARTGSGTTRQPDSARSCTSQLKCSARRPMTDSAGRLSDAVGRLSTADPLAGGYLEVKL